MGGYWAFPGGTIIEEDIPAGAGGPELSFIRCALRELFEETGVLAGRIGEGLSATALRHIRNQLLGSLSVSAWLEILDAAPLDTTDLTHICNLVTPPFSRVVYDTNFFHLLLDAGMEPQVMTGELVDSGFFYPGDAIHRWQRGELALAPPVLFLLRLMAVTEIRDLKTAIDSHVRKFRSGKLIPIYFVPGIFMAPLKTATLPPAVTTNTFIIGQEKLYLVEPATPEPDEQLRLFSVMDEMISSGKQFEAILLTHYHADHIGAVTAASRRYQLPVRAHPHTYQRIPDGYIPGTPLRGGDRIELGKSPDGEADWHLDVVHTPGHADDHLCYIDSRYHAALVGDMLSTVSTILIDPPEGHMRTYLNSLHRLLEYPIKTVFPAHGPAHHDGRALIKKLLTHRQERENKIIQALGPAGQTIAELLPKAYDDTSPEIYPIAARSLLAGLIKLEEDDICRRQQECWLLNQ